MHTTVRGSSQFPGTFRGMEIGQFSRDLRPFFKCNILRPFTHISLAHLNISDFQSETTIGKLQICSIKYWNRALRLYIGRLQCITKSYTFGKLFSLSFRCKCKVRETKGQEQGILDSDSRKTFMLNMMFRSDSRQPCITVPPDCSKSMCIKICSAVWNMMIRWYTTSYGVLFVLNQQR